MLDKSQVRVLEAAMTVIATYTTDSVGDLSQVGTHVVLPDDIRTIVDKLSVEKKYINARIVIYKFEERTSDLRYLMIVKESGSRRFKVLYPGRIETSNWKRIYARGTFRATWKSFSEIYTRKEYGNTFLGIAFFALVAWLLSQGFFHGIPAILIFFGLFSGPLVALMPAYEEWRRVTEIKLALGRLKEELGDE